MDTNYKNIIVDLLNRLHNARINPMENIGKWYEIQTILIKRTLALECKIRQCKKEIKALNVKRKNPEIRLSKEESTVVKNRIETIKEEQEEFNWILQVFKSIGDGIAFTFIDKYDIKPQNFKESAGFISEKKGLILERQILKQSFNNGVIAILNDITSVLKYADLILITEDGFLPIEAKSSEMFNSRIRRQEENTKRLFSYLEKDEVKNMYGIGDKVMRRVENKKPEINYLNEFYNLLDSSVKKGYDYCKFEDGFGCLVISEEIDDDVVREVVDKLGLNKPYGFYLNQYKFIEQAYYPFSLTFNKAEHYWNFLEGLLLVIVFIDPKVIDGICKENGYIVDQSQMEGYAFKFSAIDEDLEIKEFNMSEHYFFRTFIELVSIKYLFTETINKFKNHWEEIKGHNNV